MITCLQCGEKPAAASFVLCADCLRHYPHKNKLVDLHKRIRAQYRLPKRPPKSRDGIVCSLCGNRCMFGPGETGYCGLHSNLNGEHHDLMPKGKAFLHMYLDPLPTNCCAAWFCSGSKEQGSNLAVFFYGCSFDCLFCQNSSHKQIKGAPLVSEEDLVEKALDRRVRCVCFFGGSPEPQFPFALHVARRILEEGEGKKHICWEWNGSGNPRLVKQAAELSKRSGGTVKFDLKAYHQNVHLALCGVDNRRTLKNFKMLAEIYPEENLLTATTLLVPYYVDKQEVGKIASFISSLNPNIPYSLLVFHPDFSLEDLPVTPKEQVFECFDTAREYLKRVNIGNRQLL